MTRLRHVAILAGALAACTPSLSPQSLVDKFRVLALKASPVSGAPGEEVTLEALMSDTTSGAAPLMLWAACFPLPGQSGRQCLESLAEASSLEDRFVVLGMDPTATFALPELAPDQESSEIFVVLSVCAGFFNIPDCECPGPTCEDCLSGFDVFDLCDEAHAGEEGIVFKSVQVVSDPAQGNTNPAIAGILIGGEQWPEGEERDVACDPEGECPAVDLAVEAAAGSAETYTVVRLGEEETFVEEPYVSWFATAGSIGEERSYVIPDTSLAEVQWGPPVEDQGLVKLYFVMYDGRGGLDFAERHAQVAP